MLVVGLHYAPELTGNAPYTSALARGLSARGHSVRVLTGYPHYPDWRVFNGFTGRSRTSREDGVLVERKRQYVPQKPSLARRLLSEVSFGTRVLFARWGKPDVVLAVSPALFGTVFTAAKLKLKRIPGGIWVQDLYSLGLAETGQGGSTAARVMRRIESATLRSVNGVTVIHDRFRSQAITHLNVPAERVRVIRNWTHISAPTDVDRAAVRARLGWQDDEVIALHSGNMGVKQGLENLVEAARVADQVGAKLRLVLLGNGNQRDKLVAAAEGVERIQFLDPLPDGEFQQVLGSADVLLVNELKGVVEMSVPSKLTTYFSTGLPVIAATNDGGATAGEIEASGGGIRVDAGDPAALVDAIAALGSDPERARRLGARGLAFREVHLAEDSAIDNYVEWLTSLVDSTRNTEPAHD
ncbi:glycosyltransferase family 4 protein [Gryllotalpicola koreensis]|uniref:Glycosyltransferase family 4 protein n=1 Tax=Gryllotalpicola koreensis TaxID=993086 RepID=A0ABP8A0I9_9MICO